MFGAIEAGGTKIVCAYGKDPENLTVSPPIPTTSPKETLERIREFFAGRKLKRTGIACFGPLEIAKGRIAPLTPKIEWRGFPIVKAVEKALGCPAVLDTDVNGAALGEHLWGAAKKSTHFVYVTVGTGIGGGTMLNGQLIHGLLHPEVGHMRVRRFGGDEYGGHCPVHGDCLEGLACGPAIAARYGVAKAEELQDHHPGWALEAHYLGQMAVNLACAYSPELLILGGGIGLKRGMVEMVRQTAAQEMNGYAPLPKIVRAKLGGRAGVLGALALAIGV
ncbi:ROK family protein [Bryobacter aggregatus]|uniref:ROK family protein n=1 Tax=Bryobacter aggregatus TaxID=360054 RepID=UPI000A698AB4|nr:ROK family protein [Bryobacter aggregatus]